MAKGGFRGGFGGMNQANMMKQAQKMQQELAKMQAELESSTFTATAGGGAVKATVSGKRELTAIEIGLGGVEPGGGGMGQGMGLGGVNGAMRKVDEASNSSMSKITGMKGLPF